MCTIRARCTVPQNFNLLPLLYFYVVRVIRFITNRTFSFECTCTRSECHLTIITLIHWIKIDHVLVVAELSYPSRLGNTVTSRGRSRAVRSRLSVKRRGPWQQLASVFFSHGGIIRTTCRKNNYVTVSVDLYISHVACNHYAHVFTVPNYI